MPLIVDSRGVTTFISDDEARAQAAQLIERIESATRQSEQAGGPLSASAARQVHADFEEAERLLRETGDVHAGVNKDSLARFYEPGESERILAERAQLKREAQTVTRAGALLGIKWSDRVMESTSQAPEPTSQGVESTSQDLIPTSQDDKVTLKRDRGAGEWVLSGKGPTTRFKNYDLAEAAARRRVGWA